MAKPPFWGSFLTWVQSFITVANFNTPAYYPGAPYTLPPHWTRQNLCTVQAPANNGDAAPAIINAFQRCGKDSRVVLPKGTYYVNSVMNTTGLSNVEVDIQGTLVWSEDLDYWLNHSLPVGYQEQSSAWFFGGDKIWLHGEGVGTLNGNGQL